LHVDIGAYEFDTTGYTPILGTLSVGSVVLDPITRLGSLTISVSVNPNGILTGAWIEFGASPAYGNATARVWVGDGTNSIPISLMMTGLFPGVTVHYRVVASNLETTSGPDSVVNISLPGDFNADGVVSQSELDAVYASYLPTSPWLAMTNVAGLGGTNVTFALDGSPLGAYTVEYSTNLADWLPLGSATPRYGFTDTNAPVIPQRHYRLRYP
jgi:hypothetical protein